MSVSNLIAQGLGGWSGVAYLPTGGLDIAHSEVHAALAVTLDPLTLAATGTANFVTHAELAVTLDPLTLVAEGTVQDTHHGSLAVTLDPLTLTAEGIVRTPSHGTLTATLGGLTLATTASEGRTFPAGWARKCAVVIDHTKVAADQANFPVLLTGANLPAEIWTLAQADGGDLRFTSDAAGTQQLAADVVAWDSLRHRAEIWLGVPSLSASADTTVYVWYQTNGTAAKLAATDPHGSQAVWDANFSGIWHFEGGWTDATTNGLDGTEGISTARFVDSPLGGRLARFHQSYIDVGNGAATQLPSTFTLEAWTAVNPGYQVAGGNGYYRYLLSNLAEGATKGGYALDLYQGVPALETRDTSSFQRVSAGTTDVRDDLPHHVAATADGATINVYVDGVLRGTATQTVQPDYSTNNNLLLGGSAHFQSSPNDLPIGMLIGLLDEIRISKVVRSATWLGTQYANQSSPGTFAAAGTPAAANTVVSVVATETVLPANHGTGTVAVHLAGTGTAWDGGTTFTAAGLAGWSVLSASVADAGTATLTLACPASSTPPTGPTGLLLVGDGAVFARVPVRTPRVAVGPQAGPAGVARTVALTGQNTLWLSENSATLFSCASGVLAGVSVSSDTQATATFTPGIDATLTDHSTGATAFLAVRPELPTLTTAGAAYFARFEADQLALNDGDPVSAWPDIVSGKHLHSLEAAPVFRAAGWPGGKPCVEFDRLSRTALQASTASDWKFLHDNTPYTILLAWRTDDAYVAGYNPNDSAFVLLDTGYLGTNVGMMVIHQPNSDDPNARLLSWTNTGSGHAISLTTSNGSSKPRYSRGTMLSFDGTTLTATDWGTSIGTASKTGGSSSNPSYPLTVGRKGSVAGSQALYLNGQIAALVVIKGAALNAADQAALTAWLEAKYHPASGNTELFLDSSGLQGTSGVTRSINALTKDAGNPLFEHDMAGSGPDAGIKNFPNVMKLGTGDYRAWYSALEGLPTYTHTSCCYAVSTDGTTWTKPDLGQVSWGGNTHNNIMAPINDFGNWVWYDTRFPDGIFSKNVSEWGAKEGSNYSGCKVEQSADGITWSSGRTVFEGSYVRSSGGAQYVSTGYYREGRQILRRADGRWMCFYNHNHYADLRGQGYLVSDTTDMTGTWTDYGPCPDMQATDHDHQYYAMNVQPHGGSYVAFVMRFVTSSQKMYGDVWVSRDEGRTWAQGAADWIPNGTFGTYDGGMITGASALDDRPNWTIYYGGANDVHNATSYQAQLCKGTVRYQGIAQYAGTGTVTTRAIYAPGKPLVCNVNASGGTITAALLDASGNVLSGYADADCVPITTDDTSRQVTWTAHGGLPAQPVRIRWTLANATIYAYQFATGASLDVTLGPLTLEATAFAPGPSHGTVAVTLDPLTLSATGTAALGASVGTLAVTLGPLTLAATAASPAVGTLAVTLEPLTLAATGVVGSGGPVTGSLAVTLGPLTLAATASLGAPVYGTLAVTLDPLTLTAVAVVNQPPEEDAEPAVTVLVEARTTHILVECPQMLIPLIEKAAEDDLDYSFDFRQWEFLLTDPIISALSQVSPGGLSASSGTPTDDRQVLVSLVGGTRGVRYEVRSVGTTIGGKKVTGIVNVFVT